MSMNPLIGDAVAGGASVAHGAGYEAPSSTPATAKTQPKEPTMAPTTEAPFITNPDPNLPVDAEQRNSGILDPAAVARLSEQFLADRAAVTAMNAVTSQDIDALAVNHLRARDLDPTVSHRIDSHAAADQKRSGRCWIFAGLNSLRGEVSRATGITNFEFSQAYVHFWDKLEKANYFLNSMATLADRPLSDRAVQYLLANPIDDGGQWNMFVALVEKYGLVPKYAMPETASSSATRLMNRDLYSVLRAGAVAVRAAARGEDLGAAVAAGGEAGAAVAAGGETGAAGLSAEDAAALASDDRAARVRVVHEAVMKDIYRVLTTHLGVPPVEFDWHYRGKAKDDDADEAGIAGATAGSGSSAAASELTAATASFSPARTAAGSDDDAAFGAQASQDPSAGFVREGRMTPQEFAQRYAPNLGDYVCLVNDPRPTSTYGQRYTVEFLGNVVGARPVTYLNVPMDVMKRLAAQQLVAGRPVWFGCDTEQQAHRECGLWAADLFDYEGLYGVDLSMSKADRLISGESLMTHAMVFTGIDIDGAGASADTADTAQMGQTPADTVEAASDEDGSATAAAADALPEVDLSAIRAWRVENSWGCERADKGFWTMADDWFDEYVFEIAVPASALPEEYQACLEGEVHTLPAWDPMGALA